MNYWASLAKWFEGGGSQVIDNSHYYSFLCALCALEQTNNNNVIQDNYMPHIVRFSKYFVQANLLILSNLTSNV